MESIPGSVVLVLAVSGLTAALALTSAAQDGAADLDPAGCSDGTFVADPSAAPGLVADCRALVAVRNHWISHPDNADLPADHVLLTWRGNITSWREIVIRDQRVTAIRIFYSELSGPIPVELSQLTNLKNLGLHDNKLTGQIPTELSQLTNLTHLNLSGNKLTGQIPTELSQLTNLKNLGLDFNELTGEIPSVLSQLTNLKYLSLYNNKLTGEIPTELSQLTNLTSLGLSRNELTGQIPTELSQLTNLTYLNLSGNKLTGQIPAITELARLNSQPFDPDLGLVLNVETHRKISLGNNIWEVWICDTDGPLDLVLNSATELLNQTVSPYFEWLSEGQFIPRFSATGTFTFTHSELADLEAKNWTERLLACEDKMMNSELHNTKHKAVIIETRDNLGGIASQHAIVSGSSVVAIPGNDLTPHFMIVAHEMGHVLGWPHSYNGLVSHDGVFNEYDNSTDIMSRGNNRDLSTSTPAINRYAAGWIDPEDVAVYSGEATTHELSPIGVKGTQMLIVPSKEGQGVFYSLSPVIAKDHNRDQPKEGVEVYLIDQSYSTCEGIWLDKKAPPCRRTQPYPPQIVEENGDSAHHVRGVGEVFQLGEVWAAVQKRQGDRFTVAVGSGCGGYFQGKFCDDEDNVHSNSIEAIADWEITRGCRPNEFCPDAVITRSQIAAFLHRAATHISGDEPTAGAEVTLNDVEDDAWYRPYAEWAVDTGVMSAPNGSFDPDGAVTRADMAEMMTAAFNRLSPPAEAQGVFTDMGGQPDLTVRAAEALRTTGVTQGCSTSPLRYCPNQPVTRAQMASFFHRALS